MGDFLTAILLIFAFLILFALAVFIIVFAIITIGALIMGIKTWKAGEDPFSKKNE